MSWFCQGITEDGRLCWLPKGHTGAACQSAPIAEGSFTARYQVGDDRLINIKLQVPVVFDDGAVQLPLPGM